jgi:hypothetical protein
LDLEAETNFAYVFGCNQYRQDIDFPIHKPANSRLDILKLRQLLVCRLALGENVRYHHQSRLGVRKNSIFGVVLELVLA